MSNSALELRSTSGVSCGVLLGKDCPAILPHQIFSYVRYQGARAKGEERFFVSL